MDVPEAVPRPPAPLRLCVTTVKPSASGLAAPGPGPRVPSAAAPTAECPVPGPPSPSDPTGGAAAAGVAACAETAPPVPRPAVARAGEGWRTGEVRDTGGMAAARVAAADATAAASATAATLDPGRRCVGEVWPPPRLPHASMGRRPLALSGPPATAPPAAAAAEWRAAPHCRQRCRRSKLGEKPQARHRQPSGRPGPSVLAPPRPRPPPPPPSRCARCPRPPAPAR
jgi:hypothetical protein